MSGFEFFDFIHHAGPVERPQVAANVRARLERLGIADRVEQVAAVSTPGDPSIGVLLSHRRAIQAAAERDAGCVLVLSGDVRFLDRADEILARATAELGQRRWNLCYLGGWWPVVPPPEPGCRNLDRALNVGKAHAVAYSREIYSQVLADWPDDANDVDEWLERNGDIDRYLARIWPSFVVRPAVTTVPDLLPFEDASVQTRFTV
jgi:hypothetical protein